MDEILKVLMLIFSFVGIVYAIRSRRAKITIDSSLSQIEGKMGADIRV
jgi:TRAP-type C4-dicarboxylate transport system permease small subunit